MSSAGADCVITLVEIRSAPASAYGADVLERHAARHLAPGSRRGAVAHERHARAHLVGSHVVEQHHAWRPRRSPPRTCSTRSHSTSTVRPGHSARARAHRVGDADAGEVVVLHQHEVRQRAAVVHAAAGAHRGLLERTQAGQRLAGVPAPAPRSPAASTKRRVAVATPERWHRKLSAVRSPVSTDRSGPRHLADLGARARRRRRRRRSQSTCTLRVELREHLGRARGAGEHAVGAGDDVGDGARVGAARARR